MILVVSVVFWGILCPIIAQNTDSVMQNSPWAKEIVRRLDEDDQVFAEMRKRVASMGQRLDADDETIATMKHRLQRMENENVMLKIKLNTECKQTTESHSLGNNSQPLSLSSEQTHDFTPLVNDSDGNVTEPASATSTGQPGGMQHKGSTTEQLQHAQPSDSTGGQKHAARQSRSGTARNVNPSTAFYVKLSHSIHDPGEGHVIDYNDIVTNIGGNFNTHGTGVFHCGEAGIYVFFWSVCTEAGSRLFADLIKNGFRVGETFTGRGDEWNLGVGIAVIQLEAGDDLTVRVRDPRFSAVIIGGITTFSGFKIG